MYGKKGKAISVGFCLLLVLTACGQQKAQEVKAPSSEHKQEQKHNKHIEQPESLQVTFAVQHEKSSDSQKVDLMATVKEDNKLVKDAKVKFGVWKKGHKPEKVTKQDAKVDKHGNYTLECPFQEKGEYVASICVTTSKSHQMLGKEFKIE